MRCDTPFYGKRALPNRSELAHDRAQMARALLADCHLCAHHCGVNRLQGEEGHCHAGAGSRYFSAQVEVSDELELIPTFAVALNGCDLRCDFCITGGPSWNARNGKTFHAHAMAARATQALAAGARTVMVLGGEPTIHLPAALEFVAAMPSTATLIWKTNAHGTAQARDLLEGMFDIWVADFKFGNDVCAQRLARVPEYVGVVRENLIWAAEHSELIVRHLLMPGHLECCWKPVAKWLANELPGVKINLRSGFWPAWHAGRHPELRTTMPKSESGPAWTIAHEYGLNLVE
jgi:putative pyruvate formate lyase activating enzyme